MNKKKSLIKKNLKTFRNLTIYLTLFYKQNVYFGTK